jgi:transposase InsO family protein
MTSTTQIRQCTTIDVQRDADPRQPATAANAWTTCAVSSTCSSGRRSDEMRPASAHQRRLRSRRTRVELANAMFDYIEVFHNRQRRHSKLGYLSPSQFEVASQLPSIPACTSELNG